MVKPDASLRRAQVRADPGREAITSTRLCSPALSPGQSASTSVTPATALLPPYTRRKSRPAAAAAPQTLADHRRHRRSGGCGSCYHYEAAAVDACRGCYHPAGRGEEGGRRYTSS
eukprot:scaffold2045_cov404-Prasinococcus_capsulatus_cf.AAC.82